MNKFVEIFRAIIFFKIDCRPYIMIFVLEYLIAISFLHFVKRILSQGQQASSLLGKDCLVMVCSLISRTCSYERSAIVLERIAERRTSFLFRDFSLQHKHPIFNMHIKRMIQLFIFLLYFVYPCKIIRNFL